LATLFTVASRIFQRVGEDGEAVRVEGASGEDTLLVSSRRQSGHGGRSPDRIDDHRAEGIAQDVAK